MTRYSYIIFLSFIFLLSACDKITGPYVEDQTQNTVDTVKCPVPDFTPYSSPVRKILLEDFTGHKCVNCPTAHDIATDLKNTYGDQLVILAIHAGFFAKTDNDKYTYDFNTDAGTELNTFFQTNDVFPTGMIDRIETNSTYLITKDNWATTVDTLVNKAPTAYIQIVNDFDSTERRLCTHVNTEFLSDLNGTYHLCVFITEDSIVATQENYVNSVATDVEDYVHNHVLRDAINGTWGDTVATGTIATGYTKTLSYTYTVNDVWDAKHCSIIAFVYDDATKEILQVEQENIIE